MQRRGLEPFQSRWPEYKVEARELTGAGPYKVRIRFLAQMVPVNLITEIKVAGFDYNMSPRDVADALRDGKVVVHDKEVALQLDGKKTKINLAELTELPQADAKY